MLQGRRAGTLTAGVMLITFGVLFLLRTMFEQFDYKFIFSLWPLILVMLGAEVLLAYFHNKDTKIKYDGWAIFLMMSICLFSAGMAVAEFMIAHLPEIAQHTVIY